MKKLSPNAKTRMLCNMKQDMKAMKNNDHAKLCKKCLCSREELYYSTRVSYNEEEARVLLDNHVSYHDDTHILTCER